MAFAAPFLVALGGSAGVAGGLSAVSTAVSVLGTAASSLAGSQAARGQAAMARAQGQQASAQAAIRASEVARDSRQRAAAMRAGFLQNGIELAGSPLDLIEQADRQGQLDYLTAVYEGDVAATNAFATASNYDRQASNALIGGFLGAGGQALGGVSDFYKMRGASLTVGA